MGQVSAFTGSRKLWLAAVPLVLSVAAITIWTHHGRSSSSAVTSKEPAVPYEKPSPIAEHIDVLPPRRQPPAPPKPERLPTGVEQKVRTDERRYRPADALQNWAVIAAAYRSRDSAKERAEALKAQWRECACRVYAAPQGDLFYVIVGMSLGREDADRLRERAASAGLPSDSYVTKIGSRSSPSQ